MRWYVAGLAVLFAAGPARADVGDGDAPAVDADAPPAADAEAHADAQAAVGAGSDDGGTLALTEVRAQYTGPELVVGLGARLRWRDGVLIRSDWDDRGDWLGVIRRLELAHRGESVSGAIAAGQLAPLGVGAVADGYASAALIDRRAPGAVARLRSARLGIDASVDDVTAPTLVAGGLELGFGPRWRGGVHAAIDPGTAMSADAPHVAAVGMIDVGARWTRGPFAIAGSLVGASGRATAGVLRGEVRGVHGRLHGDAALEVRAYDGAAAAAPFGPLSVVERERMPVDPRDTGVATAIAARVGVDGIGTLEAALRTRGDRGDVLTARLSLPWWRYAQAGAYAAVGVHESVVAAEGRIRWNARWFSSVEAGRGYRRDDAGALTGGWQLAAWFGATAGW